MEQALGKKTNEADEFYIIGLVYGSTLLIALKVNAIWLGVHLDECLYAASGV